MIVFCSFAQRHGKVVPNGKTGVNVRFVALRFSMC